jgi:short-subunit dehydrogenase
MSRPRALVTGASRGIGKAIASSLSRRGFETLGTSRRPEDIREPIPGIRYLPLDLEDDRAIEACVREAGAVSIVVNNAGGSCVWPAAETPLDRVFRLFQLNVFGPLRLIHGLLPGMIERREGFILNIGSLVGRFAIPFQSSYSASKAALAVHLWSLRNEVRKHGIRVVTLDPHHIRTTIKPEVFWPSDSSFTREMAAVMRSREASVARGSSPEIVARKTIKILGKRNPAPFYSVGGNAPFLLFLKRCLPDRAAEKLVRKSFGLP